MKIRVNRLFKNVSNTDYPCYVAKSLSHLDDTANNLSFQYIQLIEEFKHFVKIPTAFHTVVNDTLCMRSGLLSKHFIAFSISNAPVIPKRIVREMKSYFVCY